MGIEKHLSVFVFLKNLSVQRCVDPEKLFLTIIGLYHKMEIEYLV